MEGMESKYGKNGKDVRAESAPESTHQRTVLGNSLAELWGTARPFNAPDNYL